MSRINPRARAEVHCDPLKPKVYRVVLNEVLPFSAKEVSTVLEKLGYKAIYSDRYGRSYRCHNDPSNTAEVKESEDRTKCTRLVLSEAGVNLTDIARTECKIESLYDRLSSLCKSPRRGISD